MTVNYTPESPDNKAIRELRDVLNDLNRSTKFSNKVNIGLTGTLAIFTIVLILQGFLSYNLTKIEIAKKQDPLIQYNFSQEKAAFEAKPGNQIEIREVRWIMPNAYNNTATAINQSSNDLTIDEISLHLYRDLSDIYNLSHEEKETFIKCVLLDGQIEKGLPLVTEVNFRRMGENEIYKKYDLLYIRGTNRITNPYIYIQTPSVLQQEVENFLKEESKFLRNDYKLIEVGSVASLIDEKGECRVTTGAPNIFNW